MTGASANCAGGHGPLCTGPLARAPLGSGRWLPPLTQFPLLCSAQSFRHKREVRSVQIGKEETKWYLITDDGILDVENPKTSTKPLSELVKDTQESWEIHEWYRKIRRVYLYLTNFKKEVKM